ncbi:MAG: twin-arginine translocation signal domain-containing protein, partial [Planctomycetota bacterium]
MMPFMQRPALSRRQLLRGSAAAAALAAAPSVRARARWQSAEPLRIAAIGAANRGAANVSGVLGAGARVVALADVDANHLAAGAAQVAASGGAAPALFADWRRLFDAHDGTLDGV